MNIYDKCLKAVADEPELESQSLSFGQWFRMRLNAMLRPGLVAKAAIRATKESITGHILELKAAEEGDPLPPAPHIPLHKDEPRPYLLPGIREFLMGMDGHADHPVTVKVDGEEVVGKVASIFYDTGELHLATKHRLGEHKTIIKFSEIKSIAFVDPDLLPLPKGKFSDAVRAGGLDSVPVLKSKNWRPHAWQE